MLGRILKSWHGWSRSLYQHRRTVPSPSCSRPQSSHLRIHAPSRDRSRNSAQAGDPPATPPPNTLSSPQNFGANPDNAAGVEESGPVFVGSARWRFVFQNPTLLHPLLTVVIAPEDVEHAVRRRSEAHSVSCRGRVGGVMFGPRVAGRAEAVEVVQVDACDERGARDALGGSQCPHRKGEVGYY